MHPTGYWINHYASQIIIVNIICLFPAREYFTQGLQNLMWPLLAGRDIYRATSALIRGLGFWGLNPMTVPI